MILYITLGLRFPKYKFVVFGSPESNEPLISSGSTIIKSKHNSKNYILFLINTFLSHIFILLLISGSSIVFCRTPLNLCLSSLSS